MLDNRMSSIVCTCLTIECMVELLKKFLMIQFIYDKMAPELILLHVIYCVNTPFNSACEGPPEDSCFLNDSSFLRLNDSQIDTFICHLLYAYV